MPIKLDRVQIVVPLEEVGNTKGLTVAPRSYMEGKPTKWVANNKVQLPYNLKMAVSKWGNVGGEVGPELKIEFSAKILGKDYPELINKNNIVRCLEEVHNTKQYNFDITRVVERGVVYSMDCTEDITMKLTKQERCDMEVLVKKPTGWKFLGRGENFVISRNDATESITAYNKQHEWGLGRNKDFRRAFQLEGAFDGKTRIEQKMFSADVIRHRLDTNNTRLVTVMNSEISPTVTLIKEAFYWLPDKNNFVTTKQKEAEMMAYINQFTVSEVVDWNELRGDIRIRNNNASAATRGRNRYKRFYANLREQNGKGLPGQIILKEIINELEMRIAA